MNSLSPPGSLPDRSQQVQPDNKDARIESDSTGERMDLARPVTGSRFLANLFCCVGLAAFVIGVFWKTVFLGQPISRFGLVAEWDSLFAAYAKGVHLNVDPSAVTIGLPSYMHSAKMMHEGVLPLWNQFNALGCPFVGDIQATVFSPVRILLDVIPNLYVYNLQLVVHVAVAAIGTFALARSLGASRIASMLSSLAYALCPFVLWYLELQTGPGYILNPAVIWLFVRAAKKADSMSACVAGIGAGVMVMSGHPEVSFFGIIYGSVLMALLSSSIASYVKSLLIAGASAVCVCAPIFFPFIEFMRNSDCYKFAVSQSAFAPWQGLIYNALAPGFGGASPFPGCLVAAMALCAVLSDKRRQAIAIFTLAAGTLVLCGKLGPLQLLLSVPPLTYIITVYAVPLFVLSIALLGALGLDAVIAASRRRQLSVVAVAAVLTIGLPIVPEVLNLVGAPLAQGNFDLTLPSMNFSMVAWKRDVLIAVLALLPFAMMSRARWINIAAITLLILNTISVCSAAKSSLAVQPRFDAPLVEPLKFLVQQQERTMAIGDHLAIPDLNGFFGFEDLRERNAMWPKRYLKFVQVCGAKVDDFDQRFSDRVNGKIDLAAVKYVLSQSPVSASDDKSASTFALNIKDASIQSLGATLTGGTIWRDGNNRQLNGLISWNVGSSSQVMKTIARTGSPKLVLVLVDKSNRVDWFGDRIDPAKLFAVDGTVDQGFSVPLPDSDYAGGTVHLKVVDGLKELSDYVLAAVPQKEQTGITHFKLVKEFANNVRIYENLGALPRVYIVPSVIDASGESDALAAISNPDFDYHNFVVLEGRAPFAANASKPSSAASALSRSKESSSGSAQSHSKESSPGAGITALKTTHGALEVSTSYSRDRPGYLVLTDSFYPGWNAYLDGKPVPIYRANYMFRGIDAPAGNHAVVFKYEPASFMIGAAFFTCFWLLFAFMVGRRSGRKFAN